MNSTEQAKRGNALEAMRAFVNKAVDEMDRNTTIVITEHAKMLNTKLDATNKRIVENNEIAKQDVLLTNNLLAKEVEQLRKEIEVVHQKAIRAEAVHSRKFWGRVSWLVRGK
jgi:hypothetical protein